LSTFHIHHLGGTEKETNHISMVLFARSLKFNVLMMLLVNQVLAAGWLQTMISIVVTKQCH